MKEASAGQAQVTATIETSLPLHAALPVAFLFAAAVSCLLGLMRL